MNKRTNTYSLKGSGLIMKDIDLAKREVAVYLSVFDVIDSDQDMIVKGAFERSIRERGFASDSNRKIAFLRHHDWQQQIGKFTRMEEDTKGLFAVGQLGTSTKGEDALRDYDEGIINEHSIGFSYVSDGIKWVEDLNNTAGGYFVITELKLYEGSAVTFGANEYTNVVDVVKSGSKKDFIESITKEIDVVTKALINGRGTDERMFDLEMKLKFLNSRLIDLAEHVSLNAKDEVTSHIKNDHEFNWQQVNSLLTNI